MYLDSELGAHARAVSSINWGPFFWVSFFEEPQYLGSVLGPLIWVISLMGIVPKWIGVVW